MGPPIYIGGNRKARASASTKPESFNGATDLHRWKLYCGKNSNPAWRSFNGATDLHRWKLCNLNASVCFLRWLQWGHRFTSVETRGALPDWDVRKKASMGPPIYIGGNSCQQAFGFASSIVASMGPPIYIGGN